MKKVSILITAGLLSAFMLAGCSADSDGSAQNGAEAKSTDAAALLTEVKTTQYFTDEKVSDEDIEKILAAGVNAPSAMNTQPWHFTAVTDEETTKILADAMSSMKPPAGFTPGGSAPEGMTSPASAPNAPEGGKPDFAKAATKAGLGDAPLTIVISCEDGAELSAGLAVQNMSAEAQLLGYGTKILISPTMALNGEKQAEYKELLKIPENQSVAAVLIIGKAETSENNPDVVSTATTRKTFDEVVTVIKG